MADTDHEVVERLLDALDDDDAPWQDLAAEAVAGALVAELRSDDEDRRENAALAWGRLLGRHQAEIDVHGDDRAARWALDVLLAAGDEVVTGIEDALGDGAPTVRRAALEAMARAELPAEGEVEDELASLVGRLFERAGARLRGLTTDADGSVRTAAVAALGAGLGARRDPAAIEALAAATRDPDSWVRATAAEALRGIEEAQDAVAALLDDDSVEVRRAALIYFAHRPDAAPATPVIARIGDQDPINAEIAVRIAGEAGLAEAQGPLALALGSASGDSRRLTIAFALGSIAGAASVPGLREVVRGRGAAALMAALILGRLGASEVTAEVVALLGDERRRVGNHSVFEAIAMLGDPAAAPALRAYIERSLEAHPRLLPPGSPGPVSPVDLDRRCALEALAILGDRAGRPLILAAMARGDVYEQRVAALALGTVGDREDLPALAACFTAKDYSSHLPARARLATVMLAPEEASGQVEPLLAAFGKVVVSRAYAAALDVLARRIADGEALARDGHAWRRLAEGVVAWLERSRRERAWAPMSFEVPEALFERDRNEELSERWTAIAARSVAGG